MTSTRENVADIICIGCQKGSTSWLHSVMNRHPDTWAFPDSRPSTSTNKEAHFWDRNRDKGLQWYRDLLSPPDPSLKTMDFTPEYAFMRESYIQECKELSPSARVIYVLRDPMARAVSAFRMRMLWRYGSDSNVRLDLHKVLPEMLPHAQIDEHGMYVRNATAWRRFYPDMMIVNYEELHADRLRSVKQLMRFSGLDEKRLTGKHLEKFNEVLAGKVWESHRFEVDRDVLTFLLGYTARTRTTVKDVLGIEFKEAESLLGQTPCQGADGVSANGSQAMGGELLALKEGAAKQLAALNRLGGELREQKELLKIALGGDINEIEQDVEATLREVSLSMPQTLERLYDERMSLARFGDGEIMLATIPEHNIAFQQNSRELREDLVSALDPNWLAPGKVLVTLPPAFVGMPHWQNVWLRTWRRLKPLLSKGAIYGDTVVSRPNFFKEEGAHGVDLWKRLWRQRDLIVVTGRGSRFTLTPELFDSAMTTEFVYTSPINAYDEIDAVVRDVTARASKDTIALLSLGPAATVLAHKLAAEGIQALDVGHISASYSFVFDGGTYPERMPIRKADVAKG